MTRHWRLGLGTAVAACVVAAPLLYSAHRETHLRNLRVVEDGVLYRSGQLTEPGLERVIREHQLRTVVTLRAARTPGDADPDAWEEDVCAANGVTHVRLVPRVWGADENGDIPADVNVRRFLEIMDDPANHPVLVHCYAGIHRTGTMCAIFRMEYQKWPVGRAITEMQRCGFDPEDMHEHIEAYLRAYRPRKTPG